jgi:isoamylase
MNKAKARVFTDTPKVLAGRPHPLGATCDEQGVNFSVFSQHAYGMELLLFLSHNSPFPSQVFRLDPNVNRTFHFWHIYISGIGPGTHYAYRVYGPEDPHFRGHRFNPNKVLIDPYGLGFTNTLWDRLKACTSEDNVANSLRNVVINTNDYDWEGDQPLNYPMEQTIIYELHVAGFTKSPTSNCINPGTFGALALKIPYLKELGITAVELLPVFDFDETEILRLGPDAQPLHNYWGYSPISFFAPQNGYCTCPEEGSHLREFRYMVKAFHRAGIEVILDVVFNHTSEGNQSGPTINFKGFDNNVYYYLKPEDRAQYVDYSGCGNTLSCNHPIVSKLIVDALIFWVKQMHVDGFRFDEGSILARSLDGRPMPHPPVLWNIELADSLTKTKIIAEAWDATGLYQVGDFPGVRWSEWNGRYRDDIRRFVRGDRGLIAAVASRIAGSADLYQSGGRLPINSTNYITCHDGFTLSDLVSYNHKYNANNGEENRDGVMDNLSWNCGAEGETDDPQVLALRQRQMRNFFALLLLSKGVPMLLAGDEVGRTQSGNNNAYCQDNPTSWFDWSLLEKNADLLRFVRQMIAFRKRFPALQSRQFYQGIPGLRGLPDITWHGCRLYAPGWNDPHSGVLAFTIADASPEADLHVILNMESQKLAFDLPHLSDRQWFLAIDTSRFAPLDILDPGQEENYDQLTYTAQDHSVVVLISSGIMQVN